MCTDKVIKIKVVMIETPKRLNLTDQINYLRKDRINV